MNTAYNFRKDNRFRIVAFLSMFLVIAVIGIFCWNENRVFAEESSITVKEINYQNSTITLKGNSADSIIYFSDNKGKTWEALPYNLNSDKMVSMDISWIPVSAKYTLQFKGNASRKVITVVFPKQITNFKASYSRVKQLVTYTNRGNRTVQWRKRDGYIWNDVNESTFSQILEKLSTQGATLYLRLAPVNGGTVNGVVQTGERASKEVSLTITKKSSAPSISIDGSKLLIVVKKNMAYRLIKEDGTYGQWITINSAGRLLLSDIAAKALYVDSSTPQGKVSIQFRNNATNSSSTSHVATLTVPVQEKAPDEEENGIGISYTSSTSLSLTIKAASSTKPFEYTIVKPDETLDYQENVWTAINSTSGVTITKTKAPVGSHIYVRKKTIAGDGDSTEFALASKEVDITGTSGVCYPTSASASDLTTLITTAGVCNENNSSGNLSFTLFSPTKTTVSSITFKDQYGNGKGSVTCKSSVAVNGNAKGKQDTYIITTKITSTASIDTITETKLYAEITMDNSDKITSTTTSGIMLYIYPATIVNNTHNEDYTNAFERIFASTETEDDTSFTFQLDFGKTNVTSTDEINKDQSKPVEIASMTFDNYKLVPEKDYTIIYDSYQTNSGESVRTATVDVKVSEFEGQETINVRGIAEPLVITLNNGEILSNAVTIKLVETAILQEAPIAWSIMERSLKEKTTETITNEDKTTSTIETEVTTFMLNLNIFSNSYAVGISDVTWGGQSILQSAEIAAGKAVVYLSNVKINKLLTTTTTTNNLVITLSNGYVIDKGCKLTIINAD